ncbi:sigma factor-like helix-turn-helix DNA-binding protein [Lachnospiraceae bacterium 45-W7]
MTLSLTGGTFVLLVRLFLFCGGWGGRLPGSERRTAKMKIRYEFINGEVSEIEVDEGLGELLIDFDRQQYNNDHKETRRHVSLDGMDYEGEVFASAEDTEWELLRREDTARLMEAMKALSPSQRELVLKVYFNGRSLVSIAAEEGVSHVAIVRRLNRIYEKLRKNL